MKSSITFTLLLWAIFAAGKGQIVTVENGVVSPAGVLATSGEVALVSSEISAVSQSVSATNDLFAAWLVSIFNSTSRWDAAYGFGDWRDATNGWETGSHADLATTNSVADALVKHMNVFGIHVTVGARALIDAVPGITQALAAVSSKLLTHTNDAGIHVTEGDRALIDLVPSLATTNAPHLLNPAVSGILALKNTAPTNLVGRIFASNDVLYVEWINQ